MKDVLALAIYIALGAICLLTALLQVNAAAVWAPAGFAVGLVVSRSERMWLIVAIGGFVVNLIALRVEILSGALTPALFASCVISAGNVVEALCGARMLRRFCKGTAFLQHPREFTFFAMMVAPTTASISATFGLVALMVSDLIGDARALEIWLVWMIANWVGIILFTSVTCFVLEPGPLLPEGVNQIELGLFVLALLFFGQAMCGIYLSETLSEWPKPYMGVPLMVWACFRFRMFGALAALVLVAISAAIGTMTGFAAFPAEDLTRSLTYLQIYIGFLAIMTMLIASALQEIDALRRSLESTVAERTSHLVELMNDRDLMMSLVVHDLQSPLYGIRNAVQQVRSSMVGREERKSAPEEVLGTVVDSANQLAERVKGLLADSLLHANLAPVDPAPLTSVLDKVLHAHELGLREKSINLQYAISGEILIEHPTVVEHLVDVLLSNAIKFSPNNGVIRIGTQSTAAGWTFTISDQGPGVAEAIRPTLFKPKSIGPRTGVHSGFGLYLAQSRAMRIGLRLSLADNTGGATFALHLPHRTMSGPPIRSVSDL